MIRETLAAGATNAMVEITPANGAWIQGRTTTGGTTTSIQGPPTVTAPYWVRLVRAGNTFTGYVSPDGVTWTEVSQYTIAMATQAYAGLAVTSYANGVLSTAVFDNVTVAGAVSIAAGPASIQLGAQEQFSSTVTNEATTGVTWQVNGVTGGSASTGTISATGLYTAPTMLTAASTVFTITAVSVQNPAVSSSVQITVTNPNAPWSGGDIGPVAAAGSFTLSGGVFTVNGSGYDIYGAADAFQFVAQPLTGNGSITARVRSQTDTAGYAKAGVMIRETLAAGATNAIVEVTPGNGTWMQGRTTTGGTTGSIQGPSTVAAPYWVRLVRAGNLFTGYVSPDGVTWTEVSQYTIAMATQAYVGLAVTSYDNGVLSTAVFDNVTATTAPGVSVTPSTVPLTLGAQQQFTAAVTNAATTGVTWQVNGVTGGSAATGTISATGLYTAPATLAASPTVFTVTAVSTQSAAVSASAAVTVTDPNVPPPPWSNGDIGPVIAAGSYSLSAGVFTVNGSGNDVYGPADAFQFVSQPLTGNGSITARVVSQTDTAGYA
jgi:regulation of enolase protein 1 (concanavalin A-like superfamily)